MKRIIFLTFFYVIFTVSCKSKFQVVQENYSVLDALVVRNYFFQQIDNYVYNSPHDLADSSILKFKELITKMELPINFEDTLENKVDYYFLKEKYIGGVSSKIIDTNVIIKNANAKNEEEIVLVPYIELSNTTLPKGYTHYSTLKIVVYLVKNDKIIYKDIGFVKSNRFTVENREDIIKNRNTREDWEKAIYQAMKEYIERLE